MIVWAHGQEAERRVYAAYPEVDGNLRRGVKLDKREAGPYGAAAVLRSRARHASLYEWGSETVRYTRKGISRGRMPGFKVFVPIMQRQRRLMVQALVALVRRAGFTVSDADTA